MSFNFFNRKSSFDGIKSPGLEAAFILFRDLAWPPSFPHIRIVVLLLFSLSLGSNVWKVTG